MEWLILGVHKAHFGIGTMFAAPAVAMQMASVNNADTRTG